MISEKVINGGKKMKGEETGTRDLKEALHAYEKKLLLDVLAENC